MLQEDIRRLIKLVLASYISFLAVYFFGFKTTTSIAFSAIFVITYGTTYKGCLSYSVNRFFAQLIGVGVGVGLFTIFNFLTFVPPSQKVALSMTTGLLLTILAKYLFRMNIAEFTMFTPAYLVLLMTPGDSFYPILRIVYCTIGIIIGISINLLIYSPNHPKMLKALFLQENQTMLTLMNGFHSELTLSEGLPELINANISLSPKIDLVSSQLKTDMPYRKEFRDYQSTYEVARKHHRLNASCMEMMKSVSEIVLHYEISPSFQDTVKALLNDLFHTHSRLLSQNTLPVDVALPSVPAQLQSVGKSELLILAEVIRYIHQFTALFSVQELAKNDEVPNLT